MLVDVAWLEATTDFKLWAFAWDAVAAYDLAASIWM